MLGRARYEVALALAPARLGLVHVHHPMDHRHTRDLDTSRPGHDHQEATMRLGVFRTGTAYRALAELDVNIRQMVRELGWALINWSYRK